MFVSTVLGRLYVSCKNMPQWATPYSDTGSSRPVAAAALAIPDLAALIFSAYCSGIRVAFIRRPA
jgi:hypothetical protein